MDKSITDMFKKNALCHITKNYPFAFTVSLHPIMEVSTLKRKRLVYLMGFIKRQGVWRDE